MGSNTSLSPLYGWSLRGERLQTKAPRNWRKNVTLISSMSKGGMGPSMVVEGSVRREVFEIYLEQVLVLALKGEQIVVMDNLCSHKGGRVREIIEGKGCKLLYLPPYSPDMNPIEEAFSKVKGLLRKARSRSREKLIEEIGKALEAVSSSDARGFFGHSGYWAVDQTF
jgi:transposase